MLGVLYESRDSHVCMLFYPMCTQPGVCAGPKEGESSAQLNSRVCMHLAFLSCARNRVFTLYLLQFCHSPMSSSLPPRPKPWEQASNGNAIAGPSSQPAGQSQLSSAFDNAVASTSTTAPRIPDRPSGNLDSTVSTTGTSLCDITTEHYRKLDTCVEAVLIVRIRRSRWIWK